jgi:hypothetical protein
MKRRIDALLDRVVPEILVWAFIGWRHLAVLPGIAVDLAGDLKRRLSD